MFKNIAVTITYFNSSQFIQDALFVPLLDSRVNEIVILDDGSNKSESKYLQNLVKNLSNGTPLHVYAPRKFGYATSSNFNSVSPTDFKIDIGNNWEKIKVIKHSKNTGAYEAKHVAVESTKCQWLILLDSDNHLIDSSLDSLFSISQLSDDEMYLANVPIMNREGNYPWDFWNNRRFGYEPIDLTKIDSLLKSQDYGEESVGHLLGIGNMLVNRDRYLSASEFGRNFKDLVSAKDASLLAASWLALGYKLRVIPSFMYFHRLHENSFWMRSLDVPKLLESEIIKLVTN